MTTRRAANSIFPSSLAQDGVLASAAIELHEHLREAALPRGSSIQRRILTADTLRIVRLVGRQKSHLTPPGRFLLLQEALEILSGVALIVRALRKQLAQADFERACNLVQRAEHELLDAQEGVRETSGEPEVRPETVADRSFVPEDLLFPQRPVANRDSRPPRGTRPPAVGADRRRAAPGRAATNGARPAGGIRAP